jgi:hypothetical protein
MPSIIFPIDWLPDLWYKGYHKRRLLMATYKLYNGDVTIKFDGRKHVYTYEEIKTGDGSPLMIAGVTSILKRLAKEALIGWSANMASDYFKDCLLDGYDSTNPEESVTYTVAEINAIAKDARAAYRRKSSSATNVGKHVHSFAEARLKGDKSVPKPKLPPEDMIRYDNGCAAFNRWFENNDIELYESERVLFSKRWLFCGTADFYGKVNGELCVLDFKTSSGLFPEMALQTAAYQLAFEEELSVVIPARYLVRFDKLSGDIETMRLPRNKEHELAFLALREADELIKRIEKNWRVK